MYVRPHSNNILGDPFCALTGPFALFIHLPSLGLFLALDGLDLSRRRPCRGGLVYDIYCPLFLFLLALPLASLGLTLTLGTGVL